MIAEEALATAFAGLIGLDIIAGGWPDSRPGRSWVAIVAHPWTTARRSLRAWAYRRHLRRIGRRAERAGWYDWEPRLGVDPSRIDAQASLYRFAFEEYARGISTKVDWDTRIIDSLTDLQRVAIDRAGTYNFGSYHIGARRLRWFRIKRIINHLRDDFDHS